MNNDPLMFVDSINVIKSGDENQNTFDSRKIQKDVLHHRIDDINAMLMYDMNIICRIILKDMRCFEGKPIRVNEKYFELLIDGNSMLFELNNIIDIGIRRNDKY